MEEKKRITFNRPYDDPYRVLAAYIVSNYPPRTIRKIMSSSAYIKSLVLQEAKQMDISGAFLDCIDQEVLTNDHLRRKNAYLKKLGEFYYSELNILRLRLEVKRFAEELNVEI